MAFRSSGVTSVPAGGLEVVHTKDLDGRFYPSDAYDGVGRTVVGVVLEDYSGSAVEGSDFGIAGGGEYAWFGPKLTTARARIFLSALAASQTQTELEERIDTLEGQLGDDPDVGFPPTTSYTPVAIDERGETVASTSRGLSPLGKAAVVTGGALAAWFGGRWLLKQLKRRRRR